ncbi:hypothetical protein [Parasitella parasitica]|uniref:Reverse transcriptase domain-containing protein n=1 Tax=Parasitella parasitica TaxID=35722 RepID=A0A0B7NIU3_9FUNG|nr:hypothetical protein [Parasitella parasitica]
MVDKRYQGVAKICHFFEFSKSTAKIKSNFILDIPDDQQISVYSLQQTVSSRRHELCYVLPQLKIKLLAYADDVLIYINSVREFHPLQNCLNTYNEASNSRINYGKFVAFPLSGCALTSCHGVRRQNYLIGQQRLHSGLMPIRQDTCLTWGFQYGSSFLSAIASLQTCCPA